ncbi:sulfite exporter TauE/SafE family protein [Candidatus Woesebacteria bacterium]|nr:sulfite exporter TauE/SafE family protein [Candidatus Woesebacteria bacterium]
MNIEQLIVYFITGVTAGGLTCMAIQGGLLTSALTQQEDKTGAPPLPSWLVVVSFLGARLIGYTLVGLALGAIGSVLRLSDTATTIFQVIAALVMITTALNLLDVHPFFRKFTFQPPSSWRGPMKRLKKSDSWFAPVGLGLFTVLLPCGVTQAMEIIAINSGNPLIGAATLFSFILGTTPIFLIFGLGASVLQKKYSTVFRLTAATMLILLSLYSVNGILVANGAPISWQKLTASFSRTSSAGQPTVPVVDGVQQIVINVTNSGYEPRYIRVKSGTPAKLTLISKDAYSCALSFRFPEFKISTFLAANDEQAFMLTPTVKGKYNFACSMGMYTGTMEVI